MTLGPTDDLAYATILRRGGRAAEIHRALRALRDRHAPEIRRKFPDIPRRVSGYNLPALLPERGFDVARAVVGSEGTCVVILGAKLRLVPSPPGRALLVLGYPSVYEAGDHIPDILELKPIGLEGIDDRLIADMKAIGSPIDFVGLNNYTTTWVRADADAKGYAIIPLENGQKVAVGVRGCDTILISAQDPNAVRFLAENVFSA